MMSIGVPKVLLSSSSSNQVDTNGVEEGTIGFIADDNDYGYDDEAAVAGGSSSNIQQLYSHHYHNNNKRLSKSSGVSSSLLTDKSYVSMVYPIAAAGAAGGGAGGAGDDNKRNRALQRRRLSHHSVATSLRSEEDGGTAAGAPTMGDADAALYKDYTYWIKIVFTLGVAQLFVEAGIRVSFMLEAAVHGDMAYYSRAILFGSEVPMSFFVIPKLYRWFEVHSQAKFLSSLGALSLTIYIYQLAYVNNHADNTVSNTPLYVIAAVIAGLLYPCEEVCSYIIIGRCGYFKCRDPTRPLEVNDGINHNTTDNHHHNHNHHHHGLIGETIGLVGDIRLADPSQTIWHNAFEFKAALGRVVAKFFGVYFALFGMAGIIIIAISSTTIFTVSGVTLNNRKEIYFWFLALFPLSGVFIFHMVPPCPRSDIIPGSPPPNVSIRKNLIFGFTHRVFLILLPLIVANGMVEAYFYGEFTLFLVTPYLGQRALPFIMGTLFIVQGLASWMWGMAVYKSIVRPRTVLLIGAVLLVLFFIFRMIIFYNNRGIIENFAQDPIVPDKWIKNKDPTSGQFVMLFALVILFAIGRASYDTQLLAILNHHYQLTEYYILATCNYKAFRSIGFFIVQAIVIWGTRNVSGIYVDNREIPLLTIILLIIVPITFIPLAIHWLISILNNNTTSSSEY